MRSSPNGRAVTLLTDRGMFPIRVTRGGSSLQKTKSASFGKLALYYGGTLARGVPGAADRASRNVIPCGSLGTSAVSLSGFGVLAKPTLAYHLFHLLFWPDFFHHGLFDQVARCFSPLRLRAVAFSGQPEADCFERCDEVNAIFFSDGSAVKNGRTFITSISEEHMNSRKRRYIFRWGPFFPTDPKADEKLQKFSYLSGLAKAVYRDWSSCHLSLELNPDLKDWQRARYLKLMARAERWLYRNCFDLWALIQRERGKYPPEPKS